jgi:tRNA(adenine34) deaminase
MVDDTHFMRLALDEALRALEHNDVPIGAVAVRDDVVIGEGHNCRERDQDPTAHAEMIALRAAAQVVGHWRLENVTLYCTLEPCTMCAGAMVLARLPRLVYATPDPKAGMAGSLMNLLQYSGLNHQVQIEYGLLANESASLIRAFFAALRADGQRH